MRSCTQRDQGTPAKHSYQQDCRTDEMLYSGTGRMFQDFCIILKYKTSPDIINEWLVMFKPELAGTETQYSIFI